MKHLFYALLLILFIAPYTTTAQNSYGTADWLTSISKVYYPQLGGAAQSGPDYGCAVINKRPVWLLISTCGITGNSLNLGLYYDGVNNYDEDTTSVVVWGPFKDTTNAFAQLTNANIIVCNNYYWPWGMPNVSLPFEVNKCIT